MTSEAHGGAVAAKGDDVFLSPRVIDQACFDELAEHLRAIVKKAVETGSTLEARLAAAAEIEARQDALRKAIAREAERAAETLRLTETRMTELMDVETRVQRMLGSLSSSVEGAREAIASQVDAARVALTEVAEEAREAAHGLFKGLDEASRAAVDRVKTARAGLEDQVSAAGERASGLVELLRAQSREVAAAVEERVRIESEAIDARASAAAQDVDRVCVRIEEALAAAAGARDAAELAKAEVEAARRSIEGSVEAWREEVAATERRLRETRADIDGVLMHRLHQEQLNAGGDLEVKAVVDAASLVPELTRLASAVETVLARQEVEAPTRAKRRKATAETGVVKTRATRTPKTTTRKAA